MANLGQGESLHFSQLSTFALVQQLCSQEASSSRHSRIPTLCLFHSPQNALHPATGSRRTRSRRHFPDLDRERKEALRHHKRTMLPNPLRRRPSCRCRKGCFHRPHPRRRKVYCADEPRLMQRYQVRCRRTL